MIIREYVQLITDRSFRQFKPNFEPLPGGRLNYSFQFMRFSKIKNGIYFIRCLYIYSIYSMEIVREFGRKIWINFSQFQFGLLQIPNREIFDVQKCSVNNRIYRNGRKEIPSCIESFIALKSVLMRNSFKHIFLDRNVG